MERKDIVPSKVRQKLPSQRDAPKTAGFWPSSTLLGSAQAISLLGYFQKSTETPDLLHQGTIFHCNLYSSIFQDKGLTASHHACVVGCL